ncbi:MAG: phospholipase D-like domain-containing protein, partial [Nevskiales bacterium]
SSRSRYGELIEAGIKICNFEDRMLHAKTMVMDGLWSTIGSANLDFRSFIHNNELNISVLDTRFAQVLEAQFLKDLKTCKPVTLEQWQQRPLSDKLKEGFSRLLDYWL